MLRRSFFVFVAMVSALASCILGGRTQTRTLPDDASVSSGDGGTGADGIVANECAPADGPALQLVFNLEDPAATCAPNGRAIQKGQRQLTFYLWGTSLPKGPGEIVIQNATNAPATATVCTAMTSTTTCVNAIAGTLKLTSYSASASTASGSYTVTLKNGETVTNTFSATVCHNQIQCG